VRSHLRLAFCALCCAALACSQTPPAEANRAYQRLAIFAPSAAEMVVALGAADRVVGIGGFGTFPGEIEKRRVVGSFDQPDIEALLELNVDHVLTTSSVNAAAAYERLGRLGIIVESFDTSTFDGVRTTLRALGERLEREAIAEQLLEEMSDGLERIQAQTAGLPIPKVLIAVGTDPLYVAGPGSHLDELIRLAGGSNVAFDATSPYQRYSIEAVLERQPDIIIDTSGQASSWEQWPLLPAVKSGRVHPVDADLLVVPGMRLVEMAALTRDLIHPELATR